MTAYSGAPPNHLTHATPLHNPKENPKHLRTLKIPLEFLQFERIEPFLECWTESVGVFFVELHPLITIKTNF